MYLEGPTTKVGTTRDPSAFHFHCSPSDVVVAKSGTARAVDFRISPDDATWHDDFGTRPIENVKIIGIIRTWTQQQTHKEIICERQHDYIVVQLSVTHTATRFCHRLNLIQNASKNISFAQTCIFVFARHVSNDILNHIGGTIDFAETTRAFHMGTCWLYMHSKRLLQRRQHVKYRGSARVGGLTCT